MATNNGLLLTLHVLYESRIERTDVTSGQYNYCD